MHAHVAMARSFHAASAQRATDVQLMQTLVDRLTDGVNEPSRLWTVEWRPNVGRTLLAASELEAGRLVFCERPLVAARSTNAGDAALRGRVPAVAVKLLQMPSDGPSKHLQAPLLLACPADEEDEDVERQPHLQSELSIQLWRRLTRAGGLDGWVRDFLDAADRRSPSWLACEDGSALQHRLQIPTVRWAIGVALINAHSASNPARGVLGLLSSMMEHSCEPTASVEIAPETEDSLISLRTLRPVPAGSPLSIAYVPTDWPRAERRRVLRVQYGFLCQCPRCCREDGVPQCTPDPTGTGAGPSTTSPVTSPPSLAPFFPRMVTEWCEAHAAAL